MGHEERDFSAGIGRQEIATTVQRPIAKTCFAGAGYASMTKPASEPYSSISSLLEEAKRFAEDNKDLGLELLLGHLPHGSDWRLSTVRTPQGTAGVSVILADGTWSVGAKNELAALVAAEIAGQTRQARVLYTSEPVRGWLQPRLAAKGRILREGQTILMQATEATGPALTGVGSWATREALSDLNAFWDKVRRESPFLQPPAWRSLIAFGEAAVATGSAGILAAIICSSRAEIRVELSLYKISPHEGQREAIRGLVAFVVQALIAADKTVFVRVDREDTPAMELYRSLGFAEVQSEYRATLRT